MPEIELSKRYKFAGDIYHDLIAAGFDAETAVSFLDAIPDAKVKEVRYGRWDYGNNDPDEDNNIQAYCTNCGVRDVHALRNKNKVPYCWRCGAMMYVEAPAHV